MAFHFEHSQLRIVRKFAKQERNASVLRTSRLIILEHILPTTEAFITSLSEVGVEVFKIIAKPYSINLEIYSNLEKKFSIVTKQYEELENTDYLLKLVQEAITKSKLDKKKIVIIDVGGYFAETLKKLNTDELEYISGVIEDTTFGHNRYVESVSEINTKVFSVARSKLKEIEAKFVGRDAVYAMDTILRGVGITISGRNALVIGYGMIGRSVARALKSNKLNVYVYDQHDNLNLTAFMDGFLIHKKAELLKQADIIFLATGNPKGGLSFEEMEQCKNKVILVSVGSKDTEYDLKSLTEQSETCGKLDTYIKLFNLNNSKTIMSVNNGTAVNFILPSIPIEVLDLVFTEILLCIIMLLKKTERYKHGVVNELQITYLNDIAKYWLRFVNQL